MASFNGESDDRALIEFFTTQTDNSALIGPHNCASNQFLINGADQRANVFNQYLMGEADPRALLGVQDYLSMETRSISREDPKTAWSLSSKKEHRKAFVVDQSTGRIGLKHEVRTSTSRSYTDKIKGYTKEYKKEITEENVYKEEKKRKKKKCFFK